MNLEALGPTTVAVAFVLNACGARTGVEDDGPPGDRWRGDVARYVVATSGPGLGNFPAELGLLRIHEDGALTYEAKVKRLGPRMGWDAGGTAHFFLWTEAESYGGDHQLEIFRVSDFQSTGTLTLSDVWPVRDERTGRTVAQLAPDRAIAFGGFPSAVIDPEHAEVVGEIRDDDVPGVDGAFDSAVYPDVVALAPAAIDEEANNALPYEPPVHEDGGLLLFDRARNTLLDSDPTLPGTNPFFTVHGREHAHRSLQNLIPAGRFLFLTGNGPVESLLERFDLDARRSDGVVLDERETEPLAFLRPLPVILDDGAWITGIDGRIVRLDPETWAWTVLDPIRPTDASKRIPFVVATAPEGNFILLTEEDEDDPRRVDLRDGRSGELLDSIVLPRLGSSRGSMVRRLER